MKKETKAQEIDRLVANVDPRAKIPDSFSFWPDNFIIMWLKQHQKKEKTK